MEVNASGLLSMNQLQVVSDGGTDDLYNDGTAAKDFTDLNLRKFRLDNVNAIDLCFPISTSISATSNTICAGQTTTLNASGATTYTWSGGTHNATYSVSPLTNTTYSVWGNDLYGCSGNASITISVNPTPTIVINASQLSICPNETATLTLSGASTYTWTDNSNDMAYTVSPTTNTTYSVIGTDGNGCIGSSAITITANPNPTISISASNSVICSGNSSSLTAIGASTYSWTNGPNMATYSVTPLANTTYTVEGTDANNCRNTSIIAISVNITPTITATASSNTICAGQTVTLTALGATTYSWMPSALTATNEIVSPTINTTYSLSGENNGCYDSTIIQITVNQLPTISVSSSNTLICSGESTILTVNTNAAMYSWSNGASTASISVTPSVTTVYSISVNDGTCSSEASVTQNVSACTALNEKNNNSSTLVIYPNPFNNSFDVKWDDDFYNGKEKLIKVYNTLGELVFITKTIENNITVNSKEWNNGAYFIMVNSNVYKAIKQE
jgi:hypothetical protein